MSMPTSAATAPWSTRISRTARGIVVTLRGRIDGPQSVVLSRLLNDLVVGQGNRVVTVDVHELETSVPRT